MEGIILFDGMCNLCSSSVQFIIKRDPDGYFSFASMQSEEAKKLMIQYQVPTDIDSIVVIDQKKYFLQSSAALQICKHLKGKWKMLTVFRVIPRKIRDRFYNYIAKNRYKWFGKKDTCMVPTVEMRARFLDNY